MLLLDPKIGLFVKQEVADWNLELDELGLSERNY